MAGTPPRSKRRTMGCSTGKRECTSIWDIWQIDETYRQSQLATDRSDAWVRHMDQFAKIDISHKAPHEQRSRYHKLLFSRSVDEDTQAPLLTQRPGNQEAQIALVDVQKQSRHDLGIQFIPTSERKRLHNEIDSSPQRYFQWLGTHWAGYFAEEHKPPTSSSSSHWSSIS